MKAELIDVMGDDLRVVNAARVSFDKESDWDYPIEDEGELASKDQKLLTYLAKHNHWTPFSHVMITMRETVPIFVARQRFKHMVGFSYNEISRRYVDTPPEFYTPDKWRSKPENAKQGSGDKEIKPDFMNDVMYVDRTYEGNFGDIEGNWFGYEDIIELCTDWYKKAIADGVCPEQARMILPQSMYTSYYTTGSLSAWARAYKLRSDPHSQKEIQDLATQWGQIIGGIEELKYSWKSLTEN